MLKKSRMAAMATPTKRPMQNMPKDLVALSTPKDSMRLSMRPMAVMKMFRSMSIFEGVGFGKRKTKNNRL